MVGGALCALRRRQPFWTSIDRGSLSKQPTSASAPYEITGMPQGAVLPSPCRTLQADCAQRSAGDLSGILAMRLEHGRSTETGRGPPSLCLRPTAACLAAARTPPAAGASPLNCALLRYTAGLDALISSPSCSCTSNPGCLAPVSPPHFVTRKYAASGAARLRRGAGGQRRACAAIQEGEGLGVGAGAAIAAAATGVGGGFGRRRQQVPAGLACGKKDAVEER